MTELVLDFLMGPDATSRAISWFGHGPNGFSHCASVLKDGRYLDARSDVLDGVPAGVHIRNPSTESWIRRRRCTLEVTETEYDAWEANLRAKIGDYYASRDIVGFILDRMLHRPGTYECAALLVNALQHIGKVPFPLPFPAHQLTPNDAILIAASAGFVIHPIELGGKA